MNKKSILIIVLLIALGLILYFALAGNGANLQGSLRNVAPSNTTQLKKGNGLIGDDFGFKAEDVLQSQKDSLIGDDFGFKAK